MLTDLFFALSIHKSTKVIVDGLTIEQAIGACYLHGTLPLTTLYLRVQARRDKGTYYNGKLWNANAMMEWEGFDFQLSAFIHTFVELLELPTGRKINIVANGQGKIEAGLYALLLHSFDPVDEGKLEQPNTHYTPHFFSDDTRPTLFLVHIKGNPVTNSWYCRHPF